eukprot:1759343-Amphidinium_carterae.1
MAARREKLLGILGSFNHKASCEGLSEVGIVLTPSVVSDHSLQGYHALQELALVASVEEEEYLTLQSQANIEECATQNSEQAKGALDEQPDRPKCLVSRKQKLLL